tara:strand:- start:407 stop:613 length:207 start_codon:yes stop_codon:yes gene_type:complete
MRMKLYGATGKGRLPTLGSLFDIKNHPKFDAALHQSRWPVVWWDEKVEARRNKKRIQQDKIDRLYPKV